MSDERKRPDVWRDMKPREREEWDRITDMIDWLRKRRTRMEKAQHARNARRKKEGEAGE